MAEINPEMLKQLLAEFEEKQAVTTEEINEIEKQIVELEARIEESRDRLKAVERDREKVGAMKSRYAEGDWSTVLKELAVQKAAAEAAELAAPAAPAEKPEKTKKGKSSNVAASDNGRGKNEAPAAFEASPAAPEISVPQFQSLPEAPPQVAPHVPTLAPTMEMDMPQTLPTPPPPGPPASESLFPFSQAQESAGDQAWAPTPAMSWESVSAQSFPPDTTEPQPTGYQLTPDGNNPFLDAASKLGIPTPQPYASQPGMLGQGQQAPGQVPPPGGPAPFAQGAPMGGPAGMPGSPPGNPEILSSAFDDEFDIADALRGDNDPPAGEKEEGDVKKINDALRGLFS